jgi:hypothetical protein
MRQVPLGWRFAGDETHMNPHIRDDVEITPQMIAAGASRYALLDPYEMSLEAIVEDIYRTMRAMELNDVAREPHCRG